RVSGRRDRGAHPPGHRRQGHHLLPGGRPGQARFGCGDRAQAAEAARLRQPAARRAVPDVEPVLRARLAGARACRRGGRRQRLGRVDRLRLDRAAPWHRRPRAAVRDGDERRRLDRFVGARPLVGPKPSGDDAGRGEGPRSEGAAMAKTSYDAIVIGSGQAGPPLAIRLAKAGMRTALVEREHLGGTCVNDGCIPTKTLVASARAAHVARRAADWGVDVGGPVRVDMRAVKERKDRVVAQSVESLGKWIAGTERLTLVWGAARFTGPHTIEVDGETLEAPKIFINVGGRPTLPPWPGIGDVPVLTNISMMAIDTLPEHLIVAGG